MLSSLRSQREDQEFRAILRYTVNFEDSLGYNEAMFSRTRIGDWGDEPVKCF